MKYILIIEDNYAQAEYLAAILSKHNYHTTIAHDFDSAINLILNTSLHYDIFFSDIVLNDIHGHTGLDIGNFIRTLKRYKLTPIVYITAIASHISSAINNVHCYGYLIKPYTESDLVNIINDIESDNIIKSNTGNIWVYDECGVMLNVNINEIIYISSYKARYIKIITKSNNFTDTKHRLSNILDELPDNFLQCNKSTIINVNRITVIDKTTNFISLQNHNLKIGRKYKEQLLTAILK